MGSEAVYLDNAATVFPKPPEVLRYMTDFYRTRGVNPGRTGSDLGAQAEETILEARRALTAFFGGTDENRLVFGLNVTDVLNLILMSALSPGDHAVSTRLEHNSVLRPLFLLEKRGVEVDLVPFDEHGYVRPEDIAARFKDNTKLVVATHGSNAIGTIQPVAEIGAACREKGVLFVVDAAQTAGLVEIDVGRMSIDVACFTGHKALMGPTGTGGMYIAEHVDLTPCRAGGTGVMSALPGQPDEYPWHMEFGTMNTIGVAGLLAGQKWIAGQGGVTKLYEREMGLARRLRDGLAKIEGVALYGADMDRDHLPVLAFNVEGIEALEVGTILDVDHGVIARTGLHCAPLVHEGLGTAEIGGSVRLSVGPFNTESQIEHAIRAVAEIASFARRR